MDAPRSVSAGRSNRDWIRSLQSRGPDQQEALTDLRNSLLRGLRGALSGRAAADEGFIEDVVQDAILRILERLSQFEGRSRFLTWATSIAVRIAMTELRRRRWKDLSLDQVIAESNGSSGLFRDEGPQLSVQLERKGISDALFELIENRLTERQRTALVAELKGMPQDEIARQLGCNRNALYKLTHDARKVLKKGLESAGYDGSDIATAYDD